MMKCPVSEAFNYLEEDWSPGKLNSVWEEFTESEQLLFCRVLFYPEQLKGVSRKHLVPMMKAELSISPAMYKACIEHSGDELEVLSSLWIQQFSHQGRPNTNYGFLGNTDLSPTAFIGQIKNQGPVRIKRMLNILRLFTGELNRTSLSPEKQKRLESCIRFRPSIWLYGLARFNSLVDFGDLIAKISTNEELFDYGDDELKVRQEFPDDFVEENYFIQSLYGEKRRVLVKYQHKALIWNESKWLSVPQSWSTFLKKVPEQTGLVLRSSENGQWLRENLQLSDVYFYGGKNLKGAPFVERLSCMNELLALADCPFSLKPTHPVGRAYRKIEDNTAEYFFIPDEEKKIFMVLVYASSTLPGLFDELTLALPNEGDFLPLCRIRVEFSHGEALELSERILASQQNWYGPVCHIRPEIILELSYRRIEKYSRHKSGLRLTEVGSVRLLPADYTTRLMTINELRKSME